MAMAADGVARVEQNQAIGLAGEQSWPVGLLDVAWRTFATGFCFAVFGVGQLIMAITVFPLLVLLVRNKQQRIRLGRRTVQLAFKGFALLMSTMGVLRYRMRGLENLRQPGTIILVNHPSLVDVVLLVSFIPDADCIVKASLFKNPFTRYAVMAANFIPSQREPEQFMDACRASLASGGCLVVFPEGTRTDPSRPLHFQRAAANLAVRLGCDMVPVVIRVSEHNLGKKSHWWRVPPRKVSYDLEVKDRLGVSPWLQPGYEPAIAARDLTASLTEYFTREIETPCPSWPKS